MRSTGNNHNSVWTPSTVYARRATLSIRVPCTSMKTLTRKYNVSRIDFWSLDVEGVELDVLKGMDWTVPIYVILIESVTTEIRKLLKKQGFRREPYRSMSKLNEIWVNPTLNHGK